MSGAKPKAAAAAPTGDPAAAAAPASQLSDSAGPAAAVDAPAWLQSLLQQQQQQTALLLHQQQQQQQQQQQSQQQQTALLTTMIQLLSARHPAPASAEPSAPASASTLSPATASGDPPPAARPPAPPAQPLPVRPPQQATSPVDLSEPEHLDHGDPASPVRFGPAPPPPGRTEYTALLGHSSVPVRSAEAAAAAAAAAAAEKAARAAATEGHAPATSFASSGQPAGGALLAPVPAAVRPFVEPPAPMAVPISSPAAAPGANRSLWHKCVEKWTGDLASFRAWRGSIINFWKSQHAGAPDESETAFMDWLIYHGVAMPLVDRAVVARSNARSLHHLLSLIFTAVFPRADLLQRYQMFSRPAGEPIADTGRRLALLAEHLREGADPTAHADFDVIAKLLLLVPPHAAAAWRIAESTAIAGNQQASVQLFYAIIAAAESSSPAPTPAPSVASVPPTGRISTERLAAVSADSTVAGARPELQRLDGLGNAFTAFKTQHNNLAAQVHALDSKFDAMAARWDGFLRSFQTVAPPAPRPVWPAPPSHPSPTPSAPPGASAVAPAAPFVPRTLGRRGPRIATQFDVCRKCGGLGHFAATCTQPPQSTPPHAVAALAANLESNQAIMELVERGHMPEHIALLAIQDNAAALSSLVPAPADDYGAFAEEAYDDAALAQPVATASAPAAPPLGNSVARRQ